MQWCSQQSRLQQQVSLWCIEFVKYGLIARFLYNSLTQVSRISLLSNLKTRTLPQLQLHSTKKCCICPTCRPKMKKWIPSNSKCYWMLETSNTQMQMKMTIRHPKQKKAAYDVIYELMAGEGNWWWLKLVTFANLHAWGFSVDVGRSAWCQVAELIV